MAVIKFNFFVIAAILYTGVLTPGANARRPHKIVGGTRTDIAYHPCLAAFHNGYTHQTCGATLITMKHTATAAHCVVDGIKERNPRMHSMKFFTIVSGSSNRRDVEGDKVLVSYICNVNVHRHWVNYPPSPSGDIAILTLCEPIPLGPTRQPAKLPTRQPRAGERGLVLGWGWTQPEESISVDELHKAEMTITSVDDDHFFAIGRSGVAFCNGDSGSPFLINNTIVGIVSNSPDCTGNTEGWYTNVFAYNTWIEDVIIFGEQSIFSGYVREMEFLSNYID